MGEPVGYRGPPRRPEDVIAAALADEELMRQLTQSLEEERLGIPAVPLQRIREEATQARQSA